MAQLQLNESDFQEATTWFATVILPLPIPRKYTYRVPRAHEGDIQRGSRVIVQFGKRKIFTGIVDEVTQEPPEGYEAKLILEVLDEEPIVTDIQLKLFEWMASYYMCTVGEVIQAALPSGLKLSSESKVQLHPYFNPDENEFPFTDEELLILDILEKDPLLGFTELAKATNNSSVWKSVKSLIEKDAVLIFEQVSDKYTPKKEKRIVINPKYRSEEKLMELLDSVANSAGQEDVLMGYLQYLQSHSIDFKDGKGIPYSYFTKGDFSISSVNTLIKKDIFTKFEITVPRFIIKDSRAEINLSEIQSGIYKQILNSFEQNTPVLLHGITGSGKTEIYIELINSVLENGQQVLFLLPEIALTTQIIDRLSKAFGKAFGVYHSKYSDNERVEVWNGVLDGTIKFVVGVRSSIFLPFQDLGLIIVDEEHETSYKQHNPAPRYQARDVALVLAQMNHANVLLGTATPSMESYYNALKGKYKLISLEQRYGEATLPDFVIADLAFEKKVGNMKGEFSPTLINGIRSNLENKDQSIIFQNRRGYSPMVHCEDCDWTAKCIQCSVSMTYHQYRNEMKCHYCGYTEKIPRLCPDCGSNQLKTIGFGTQKLEEDLSLIFPEAQIQRMDLDTTRNKGGYERIIKDFENKQVDILIGTQMLTKGLDFDSVSLVGIIDLDRMLHFPDFRAFERTFQLAVQVSGRAGRRDKKGRVVIQTRSTTQPILRQIQQNDWKGFYQTELPERKNYNYPPFTRLIKITVRNKSKETAFLAASDLAVQLKKDLGNDRVLGPQEPSISMIRNQYLMDIWIKIHRNDPEIGNIKHLIIQQELELQAIGNYSGLRIINDVDPY